MAKVNRFTQVRPAQYNPMSLQELMVVPALKRQQHDNLLENVANTRTALSQADYMDLHGEDVSKVKKQLEAELERQVNEVSSNGISGTLKSDFINLHGKYQNEVGPQGTIGKAQAAKASVAKAKEEAFANAVAMGLDPQQSLLRIEEEYAKYAATQGNGVISNMGAIAPPKYRDFDDDLIQVKKMLGDTVSTERGEESYKLEIAPDGGLVMITKGGSILRSDNLRQLKQAENLLKTNWISPDGEGSRVDRWNDVSPADRLNAIKSGLGIMENTKVEDKRGTNFQYIRGPAADAGVQAHDGDLNYEIREAKEVQLVQQYDITKLRGIQGGKDIVENEQVYGNLMGVTSIGEKQTIKPSMYNQFSPEKVKEYQELFEQIKFRNPNLKDVSFNSKEGSAALADYLERNQSITRQDRIITDDFVTKYGDNSIGTEKTSGESISKAVKANPKDRKYFIDGEIYTYDTLPDSVKENFDNLTYGGYLSPKNFLSEQYGKEAHKNMFASPLKMSVRDKEGNIVDMYVSRSGGEMESAAYKADLAFNDVFINTNKYPDIPYTLPIGRRDVSVTYNRDTNSYTLAPINPGDQGLRAPQTITESALQTLIYKATGVKVDKTKK